VEEPDRAVHHQIVQNREPVENADR
jgi:hypothetical protein